VKAITRIFNSFVAVILVSLVVGIVIILATKDAIRAVSIGASLPFVLAAALFIRWQRFELAAVFLAVVLLGLCTAVATQGLGIHSISNVGIAAVLIIASMVTKKRTMVFLTLFAIACLAWQVFGELAGAYRPQALTRSVPGDFLTVSIIIGATAFIARLLSEALFQSHRRLHNELREREGVEVQREALIHKLEQTQEKFLQSQKMEAVGRLAGGIAHDFNNLLTIIGGYSELLREDVSSTGPQKEHAEEIAKAARRAAGLTKQLLAFSRKQVLQIQVVDLNRVVRDMEGILTRIIGEDIELSTVLAPGLGRVRVDPLQIEQAILNLAVNARDAMTKGGRLILETSEILLDETGPGGHVDLPPGRYVMLRVSDTGIGMTPEILGHLYEPFFTTKEQGKGTGLGLSMVYGIVRQCSGSIEVDSTPERGTSFKIFLPSVKEAPSESRQGDPERGHYRGSETVLVVEDEPAVLEFVFRVLAGKGYTVLRATRAAEALRICRESETPIHLVLTDMVMPGGMSGRELAHELSQTHPGMQVLFMSGYVADGLDDRGTPEVPIQLLQKPFTPESLAQKVREMLDAAKREASIPGN
jgi:signal transduction histidine kinase